MVGSDSGRIVILEYIPSKNTFERVSVIENSFLGQELVARARKAGRFSIDFALEIQNSHRSVQCSTSL